MAGSVFEGKTFDEAVKKGLAAQRLERAEAVITVIEEGKSGFLGIGSRPFRVSVLRRPGGPLKEPVEREDRGGRSERGGRGGRDGGRGERGGRGGRDGGRGGRDEKPQGRDGGRGGRDGGRDGGRGERSERGERGGSRPNPFARPSRPAAPVAVSEAEEAAAPQEAEELTSTEATTVESGVETGAEAAAEATSTEAEA